MLDQLSNGRSRNEDARIDVERKTREPSFVREVHDGDSFFDTARNQLVNPLTHSGGRPLPKSGSAEVVRQVCGMKYDRGRIIDRVIGPVSVEHLGSFQPPGTPADQIAHSDVG